MTDPRLTDALSAIDPLDGAAMREASERQKQLTKPAGALGALEDVSVRLAGIQAACPPVAMRRPVVTVFARQAGADVYVVDVGVAADLAPGGGLFDRKVRAGTSNLATGPAMSRDEA